jgi:proton-translocating NADH-quinone oxidoreductase chain N
MDGILHILALGFLALPPAGIIVSNLLYGPHRRVIRRAISMAVAALQSICAAVCFGLLVGTGRSEFLFGLSRKVEPRPDFALTPFGLVVLFCAGIVCLASELVATRTVHSKTNSFTNLLMILLAAITGICVARDFFTLYAFMEITGLSSFTMIAIYREDESLEGAFKYLTLSCVAGAFILAGLSFLFMLTGSLHFEDITVDALLQASPSARALLYAAAALLLSGFCIKTGAAPFHNWLPDAYQSADTSVSVLLSGIVNKAAGIYGVMTTMRLFSGLPGIRTALACVAIFSITLGALMAQRQVNFKRVCAYSSVSQMGYILLGLAACTPLGFVGAAMHVFSHSMFKSTLFADAAAVHEQTGTFDIRKMGGLQKQMPSTAFTSVIAFLSAAGIPPLSGFWSKLTIVVALWTSGMQVAACFALVLSILTGAYFLRLQREVFFGKPKAEMAGAHNVNGGIRVAEMMLTAFTVVGGLAYPFLLALLGVA